MVGKLQRVPMRDVFKHEARDFTTWLRDNIDVLNEVLGLSLSNPERERPVGDFNVDLVAEDEAGNPVVIENQLEKSNHEHLGKLITYLTAIGAKIGIWIVSDPRPEHINAISWLNESSSAAFYLLKMETIRIGGSEPAPLLTRIVGPSEESRAVGETKKELAERYEIRQHFWDSLLSRAKTKTKLHANISPGKYGWVGAGAGKTGLGFNYVIFQHEAQVELYIDRGKEGEAENKAIFDQLAKSKSAIEAVFGSPLNWERLDSRRASRIGKRLSTGGYRDDEVKWPQIQDEMIDTMVRFEKAIRPYIAKLSI